MFSDIGPLELVTIVILAVLVFGPDKLPKVIQDAARFIRKIREFSDSAKEDIRRELGPEFKDFEFEDLNPKNFAKKHLLDNEDLGLKELRNGFDLKKEMAEVTEAVHTVADAADDEDSGGGRMSLTKDDSAKPDLRKRPSDGGDQPPPYDADAT
ncbi:MAG: Sec-independent protein translocase subunit TatB [Kitasatospora sp.]|nr:Sec-independent protein translocase subunit TatB [Kitasatospora sp.]